MTIEEIRGMILNSPPGPWFADPHTLEIRLASGDWLADVISSNAALIAAAPILATLVLRLAESLADIEEYADGGRVPPGSCVDRAHALLVELGVKA